MVAGGRLRATLGLVAGLGAPWVLAAQPEAEGAPPAVVEPAAGGEWWRRLDFGLEGRVHYRDSDLNRFPVNFPFPPEQLPPGAERAFLETVNEGSHLEASTLTLLVDGRWAEAVTSHAKIDIIDLHDRNPTSTDREIDVDELWIRFGRETEPAVREEKSGAYLKIGKMPKFERQDDRHLESYGLVSTAFNRFEDFGLELGADLGPHFYVKATVTQGNPVFLRDPNALAGDNGTPDRGPAVLNPDPALKSGIVILYDTEVEDIDVDGDLEVGAGLGLRFATADGRRGVDLLAWGYERTLAETVDLNGTFYGGDLDLLRGPENRFPFPITSDNKREVGANLWLYLGGFSLFAQYVDQDLAGLGRIGYEAEAAWAFDLPLKWAVGGRQLFPYIQPAVRFSRLDPDFRSPPVTPSPSFSWKWDKLDFGVRIGIVSGVDVTLEYAVNDFILGSGAEAENDEALATLRFRVR